MMLYNIIFNMQKKKNVFIRISIDDVRLKLSTKSKNKKVVSKPVDHQLHEDSSDEYEFGKDLKEEKKRKA